MHEPGIPDQMGMRHVTGITFRVGRPGQTSNKKARDSDFFAWAPPIWPPLFCFSLTDVAFTPSYITASCHANTFCRGRCGGGTRCSPPLHFSRGSDSCSSSRRRAFTRMRACGARSPRPRPPSIRPFRRVHFFNSSRMHQRPIPTYFFFSSLHRAALRAIAVRQLVGRRRRRHVRRRVSRGAGRRSVIVAASPMLSARL